MLHFGASAVTITCGHWPIGGVTPTPHGIRPCVSKRLNMAYC